jgi:hypothetical protein
MIKSYMKHFLSEEIRRIKTLMSINESIDTTAPNFSTKIFDKVDPTWGGGPNSHAARHPDPTGKDWWSNNAYDIMAPEGTPVYSISDGYVDKITDNPPGLKSSGGKRIYGDSITVRGSGGDPDVFYTHITNIVVEDGDPIKKGQLLAYIVKGELGIPDHVHVSVKVGDVKDFLDVNGNIEGVDNSLLGNLSITTSKGEETPIDTKTIMGTAAGLTAAALSSLDIKRPESDISGIASRFGITDVDVNVDSVSGVLNKIILSSEGIGTDETSIHDAIKKLSSCYELDELNKMVERKEIDGKKYKDVFDYINSEMNYGDELFVKSLVNTINNICPNTVTDKGNQILRVNKSIYVGGGIDKVSPIKLLNDLKSYGLSDKASKGVVANAYGESGFNVKAKGDSGSYAGSSNRSINIEGKKYCSFGLWQFNVCGGMGVSFLKNYNISADSSNDEEKLRVLFDYNKQVEFMSKRIKEEQINSEKDVKTWIDWIVDNVERPSDRYGAKMKRQEFARQQGWS